MKHGSHSSHGACEGSVIFFMEKQNCFSSHLPGKEDTDLWLAWLVRSVVATASCPPCALWLPLLSAAAYRDTRSGCGQTRRKQALEQNTKYVLMQTSLIMESKWREMVKKKRYFLAGRRGNVLHHCKEGMWKVKPFRVYITLHKTKFRLFHSYCKI